LSSPAFDVVSVRVISFIVLDVFVPFIVSVLGSDETEQLYGNVFSVPPSHILILPVSLQDVNYN